MGLIGKSCPGCAYCVHSDKNLMKCFPESEDCEKEHDLDPTDFETSCHCNFFELIRDFIDYIDRAFGSQSSGSCCWIDDLGQEHIVDIGYAYQWWEECMKPQLKRAFLRKE